MGFLSHNGPRITRRQAFSAIPTPVAGVRVLPSDDEKALMLVVQRKPFRSRWLERLAPVIRERRIELDEIGSRVWRRLDGHRDVRCLIQDFAREYHVDRREAEAVVVEFLKSLMRRGLITMQIPRSSDDGRTGR